MQIDPEHGPVAEVPPAPDALAAPEQCQTVGEPSGFVRPVRPQREERPRRRLDPAVGPFGPRPPECVALGAGAVGAERRDEVVERPLALGAVRQREGGDRRVVAHDAADHGTEPPIGTLVREEPATGVVVVEREGRQRGRLGLRRGALDRAEPAVGVPGCAQPVLEREGHALIIGRVATGMEAPRQIVAAP